MRKAASREIKAKIIGSFQAIKAITIVLLAAFILTGALMKNLYWFAGDQHLINILIGVFSLYPSGFVFGSYAGNFIIIKKSRPILTGIITGYLVVITGTFFGCMVGYFQEGYSSPGNGVYEYILNPILMIAIVGSIPIILTAIWLGRTIKLKGEKQKIL